MDATLVNIIILLLGLACGVLIMWWSNRNKTEGQVMLLKEEQSRQLMDRDQRIDDMNHSLGDAQEQVNLLGKELATARTENANLEKRIAEQYQELESLNERMTSEFKLIAAQLLEEKGGKLKQQQEDSLKTLLDPFKDRILEFQKKVDDIHREDTKERSSLKKEVSQLVEQNLKLSQEANNLAKALKGDVKMQGNWGEMILENLLEKSGLVKDREYFTQMSHTTEDGSRLQPDVEIKLPEGKFVIVDSKVTLVAYERFVSSESEDERKQHLRDHVIACKAHFKGLSSKAYTSIHGHNSPDFLLMFIPIEGAFATALQGDQQLFQEAFDKGVIIVSPSTLLATLQTIATIWKQERLSKSHLEIAERAGFLYDKFVNLSETLVQVGTQMDTAKKSYVKAMGQLTEGSGNLITQVEKLKHLGAKAKKDIPKNLKERASNALEEGSKEDLFT